MSELLSLQLIIVKKDVHVNNDETNDYRYSEKGSETTTDSDAPSITGTIYFATNPTSWSKTTPTWIVDWNGQWVAEPIDTDNTTNLQSKLSQWLSDCESHGWNIQWIEHKGTKEEIVELLSQYASWNTSHAKLKKEILAQKAGRMLCINNLSSWISD